MPNAVSTDKLSLVAAHSPSNNAWVERSINKTFNPLSPTLNTFLQFSKILQSHYLSDGWARELFKPSLIQQVLNCRSKNFFILGMSFSGGNDTSRGVFALFWPSLPGPGRCPNGTFFGLNVLLESWLKYESLEPLINCLAHRELKLWLINQKLTRILLPQKPLWGAFHPRNKSPWDWTRELFKPSEDLWRHVVCN